jgi:hypothetical protein
MLNRANDAFMARVLMIYPIKAEYSKLRDNAKKIAPKCRGS